MKLEVEGDEVRRCRWPSSVKILLLVSFAPGPKDMLQSRDQDSGTRVPRGENRMGWDPTWLKPLLRGPSWRGARFTTEFTKKAKSDT